MAKKLINKNTPVICVVRCEELKEPNDELFLQLAAKKLPKMDWFGKADPYFIIYRQSQDGGWAPVHKSEVIKNTYQPVWKLFGIKMNRVCNNDYSKPIRIRLFDWNKNSEPDFIGECILTIQDLKDRKELDLRRSNKKDLKSYDMKKKYGQLYVQSIQIKKNHTFVEYCPQFQNTGFTTLKTIRISTNPSFFH